MRFPKIVLGILFTSALGVLACTAETGQAPDDQESEEELRSASWEKLAGAWEGDFGAVHNIVFTHDTDHSGHKFFADVDNGRRCVRAPCPSTSRITGWYTAGAKTFTLHSEDSDVAIPVLGRYTYAVAIDSAAISVTHAGNTQTWTKGDTYCTQAADCAGQLFIRIRCVGHFTCSAQNSCGFSCGVSRNPCANFACPEGQHCTAPADRPYCVR